MVGVSFDCLPAPGQGAHAGVDAAMVTLTHTPGGCSLHDCNQQRLAQQGLSAACAVVCCGVLQSDPLRKFYSSLLQEKPDSTMALKW